MRNEKSARLQANETKWGSELGLGLFSIYNPKHYQKTHAVCNLCFLRYRKDAEGKIIDGDRANWEISYAQSRSRSKLNSTSASTMKKYLKPIMLSKQSPW